MLLCGLSRKHCITFHCCYYWVMCLITKLSSYFMICFTMFISIKICIFVRHVILLLCIIFTPLSQNDVIDDQWRYSPDRALASQTGFMIVYSTMWGYQLHDRPVLDTLIQPSETSSSNYQKLSLRSRETRVRNGRWILPTSTYRARRVLLHAVNLRHGTDRWLYFPSEGRRATDFITIVLCRVWTREPWVQWQAR
jgi:hypothetical protein